MAYRLKRGDESVEGAIRRVAREQIGNAIAAIDDGDMDPGRRVHDVRTRCKKLRGLLRLVRPVFPAYRAENREFRDIAKRLARLREAAVMVDTCDDLSKAAKKVDRQADLDALRTVLADRARAACDGPDLADLLAASRASMLSALARVDDWRLASDGFAAIEVGLTRTYRQSVKAFAKAWHVRTGTAFHDWRTRSKAHGYQTLLLRPIQPARMEERAKALGKLGELLGEHHDVAVLQRALRTGAIPGAFASLGTLFEDRRAVIERKALRLGARLFEDPPDVLAGQWEEWWSRWRPARPKYSGVRLVVSR